MESFKNNISAFDGKWECSKIAGLQELLQEVDLKKHGIQQAIKPVYTFSFNKDENNFRFSNGVFTRVVPIGKSFDDRIGNEDCRSIVEVEQGKMVKNMRFKNHLSKNAVVQRSVFGEKMIEVIEFGGKTVIRTFRKF